MLKATKIRIYPNREQTAQLEKEFGHARYIYNWALNLKTKAYKRHGWRVSYNSLKKHIAQLKKRENTSWLSEAHSQVLQQAIHINLQSAYKNFFDKRARYPHFKKKRNEQSIHYPQGVKLIKEGKIFVPRLKQIKAVIHREICGQIKTVTIRKTNTEKYFASILTDDGKVEPKTIKKTNVSEIRGIDLGIKDFLVEDTGSKEVNPKYLSQAERTIIRKQKKLSRKKKGSNNRNKSRMILAKSYEKLSNIRNDFQHKLSKKLVDENQVIGYEGLRVKNMLKNHRLAKSISDVGWRNFLTKLQYKSRRQGKLCIEVDSFYPSSKLCNVCGYKNTELTLSNRSWTCSSCSTKLDRDINAAINIKNFAVSKLKAEGLSVSAC